MKEREDHSQIGRDITDAPPKDDTDAEEAFRQIGELVRQRLPMLGVPGVEVVITDAPPKDDTQFEDNKKQPE